MKTKKILALALVLVMAMSLTAMTAEAAGPSAKMSFGNTQPDGDVESMQLYACADTIKEATNGDFAVEVFTNSALGDTDDILEQAIQGAAVLTVTDPGRLADYIPEYGILQMPYIMADYTQIDAITGTDTVAQWEKGFEEFFETDVPRNPLRAEFLLPAYIGKLREIGFDGGLGLDLYSYEYADVCAKCAEYFRKLI